MKYKLTVSVDEQALKDATGENDLDLAVKQAAEQMSDSGITLKKVEPVEVSFFYTFGTDPGFPFGEDEYVEVIASDELEANQKFKEKYPSRPGTSLMNCAFVYRNGPRWAKIRSEYYPGKNPVDIIR